MASQVGRMWLTSMARVNVRSLARVAIMVQPENKISYHLQIRLIRSKFSKARTWSPPLVYSHPTNTSSSKDLISCSLPPTTHALDKHSTGAISKRSNQSDRRPKTKPRFWFPRWNCNGFLDILMCEHENAIERSAPSQSITQNLCIYCAGEVLNKALPLSLSLL